MVRSRVSRPAAPSPDAASPARVSRRFPRVGRDAIALAVIVMAVAGVATLHHGADRLRLPAAYVEQPDKADTLFHLALAKSAADGEWIPGLWKVPRALNAPATANWNDWPIIEELPVLIIGLAGRVCGLFAGYTLVALLAQAVAAATFFLVARSMGACRLWAVVGGIAYGLAPFIFAQQPHHPFVAHVWHIPLGILVWRWVSTPSGFETRSRWMYRAMLIGFITGLQHVYFTNVFCQLTLLGAGVLAWQRRSWRPLQPALVVVAAAATAFALMNLDTWTYRLAHGPNPNALVREYKWLEIYGLKLVDLVIPPVTHRAAPFAAFAAGHRAAAPLLDEGSYLGIVGIAALGLLVADAAGALLRGRADEVPLEAWAALWIVLTFTTGGLNAILGACGFTLFRTGCRYSIVILALALLHATRRLSDWQRAAEARAAAAGRPADMPTVAALTIAAGIVALILFDQVPRGPTPESTATIGGQVETDRDFVRRMEAALPPDAMVFQLPVMEFPEAPLPGIPPYDHLRPYLYSRTLRFSFGAMKGRERESWQQAVQRQLLSGARVDQERQRIRFDEASVRLAVAELERRGFAAIYVNRNGFPDRGQGLETALTDLGLAGPPIGNATGELACFVLRAGAGGPRGDAP